MELGVVKRNTASATLAQLKAGDPLPLRRAKINQGAAVRKSEIAAKVALDASIVAQATLKVAVEKREIAAVTLASAEKAREEAETALALAVKTRKAAEVALRNAVRARKVLWV